LRLALHWYRQALVGARLRIEELESQLHDRETVK
jgi:hypothetical protein